MSENIQYFIKQVLLQTLAVFILGSAILFILIRLNIINIGQIGLNQNQQTGSATQVSQTNDKKDELSKNPILGGEIYSDIIQRFYRVAIDSAVVNASTHIVYEGKITELNTKGGFFKTLNLQYVLMLKIKGKGNIISQIYFSPSDIKHLTLVQKVGDEESPITIGEFKVGDSIILDMTTDETKLHYDNMMSGKLTKI